MAGSSSWGSSGNDGHYLLRLRKDGSLDSAFGDEGLLVDAFADESAFPLGIVVQPNGRILLARTDRGSLVRAYRPDGSRARGFGRNGNVRIEGNYPDADAPLYRSDGRILIVGQPDPTIGREGGSERQKLFVDALQRDGSRDTAFGRDGRARMSIDIPAGELSRGAATLLRGGAIAVTSEVGFFTSDVLVARFTSAGKVDRDFGGGDGWRRFDLGPVDSVFSVVELPCGRLAVVGGVYQDRFGDDTRSDAFVVALRRDGRLWRSFGTDGVVRDDLGGRSAAATDAVVVDGKLIVVGGRSGDMFASRYFLR